VINVFEWHGKQNLSSVSAVNAFSCNINCWNNSYDFYALSTRSSIFVNLSFVIFPRFEWKQVQREIMGWFDLSADGKWLTGKQKKETRKYIIMELYIYYVVYADLNVFCLLVDPMPYYCLNDVQVVCLKKSCLETLPFHW